VGHYVGWGLPSINSVVVAIVLYVAAARLGLVRGAGRSHTYPAASGASTNQAAAASGN
jgi:cytosine permease